MPRSIASLKKYNSRGDVTITLILGIILISGVFLAGGVLPNMKDDTLNMESTGVVEGVRSEDAQGQSLIAAAGSSNDSKKTLQMKQLILMTATPIPTSSTPSTTSSSISVLIGACEEIKGPSAQIEATVIGTESGYISVEIESGSSFQTVSTAKFSLSPTTYNILLQKIDGFTTKKWKVKLFSGGTAVGGIFSGGTERASSLNKPIPCN